MACWPASTCRSGQKTPFGRVVPLVNDRPDAYHVPGTQKIDTVRRGRRVLSNPMLSRSHRRPSVYQAAPADALRAPRRPVRSLPLRVGAMVHALWTYRSGDLVGQSPRGYHQQQGTRADRASASAANRASPRRRTRPGVQTSRPARCQALVGSSPFRPSLYSSNHIGHRSFRSDNPGAMTPVIAGGN